jgi:phosphohistidine phosphatase
MMARRLFKKGVKLDLLVSSPAKRAKRTAQSFAEEFQKDKDNILIKDELYMAGSDQFYKVISQLDDSVDHVAIFSHNPGITTFANALQVAGIDDMPTCSVFAITISTDSWSAFRKAKKEFWFFDFPKNVNSA